MASTPAVGPGPIQLRPAEPGDAPAIAALHADSWRRHYRGSYSDSYLDGPVEADRQAEWHRRFGLDPATWFNIVACAGDRLVGFSHVWVDGEDQWGALLDNLHVSFDLKRSGLGRQLLGATADRLQELHPGRALYLWVLEQNTAAQAFYRALGGTFEDRRAVNPPMGRPENLDGQPWAIRVVWPDPSQIRANGDSPGLS